MKHHPVVLHSVSKRFGQRTVLADISLETRPGQVLAVYGRSGSGKTTLLNLIGGLDQPTSGNIQIGGRSLADLPPAHLDALRRSEMAFIFQSYGLLSAFSAAGNVDFALRLAGVPPQERPDRTEAALAAVGLADRSHHRPAELSGGERQRVAVARALAVRPRLLLADEPTGALDYATAQQIVSLLATYARTRGANVWIATHDVGVGDHADIVWHMQDGKLVPMTKREERVHATP